MLRCFDVPWEQTEASLRELAQRRGVTFEEMLVQILHRGKEPVPSRASDCPAMTDYSESWPNLSRPMKEHLAECDFCQQLVEAAFPILVFEPFTVKDEIAFADELPETESCPFRKTGGWFGPKIVNFLPMRKHLDHYQDCLYCLILIQHYNFNRHRHTMFDCLDAKSWQVYPVYHPDDQDKLTEHVRKCTKLGDCAFWAPFRFEFNLRRDWKLFRKLKRQPRLVRNIRQYVRARFKKPIGDFISSWRFHFGDDGPFSRRHPWAVWDDTDRMLKLLRGQTLDYTERLYRAVLMGELQPLDGVLKLWRDLPRPREKRAQYLVPAEPFQYKRFELAKYLAEDAEARKLGITIEEVRARHAKRAEEIAALIENGDIIE